MFTSQASCFKTTLPLTSGSARRCESPTTNTRFLWTTLTLARCLRFSVTFCFFSFCFCFFSFFILWISSCERGLYTAGSSGYGYRRKKNMNKMRRLCWCSQTWAELRVLSVPMKTSSMPHLSTCRTQPILISADAVPTEAADLIATGAWEEVDIIDLQRFHAQWALHGVVLHLRAVGHPIVQRGCRLKLSRTQQ